MNEKYVQELQRSARVGALNINRRLSEIAHQADTRANDLRAFNALVKSPSLPNTDWTHDVTKTLDRIHDDLAKLALVAAQAATKDT